MYKFNLIPSVCIFSISRHIVVRKDLTACYSLSGIPEIRVPLSEFINFILWKVSKVITLPKFSLPVLPATAEPHIQRHENAHNLEPDTDGDTRDVVWPVAAGEHKSGDNTAELTQATGKGRYGSTLNVSDDLVYSKIKG